MTLSFNHGAGRAASKLFHLMLNDCHQLIDAITYGLQRSFSILRILDWTYLPQELRFNMCPDIRKDANLPKHATIYDCLYKAV